MATRAQVTALLAHGCPFCGATVGEPCGTTFKGRTVRPRTLDGEAHDARWRAAGLGHAAVYSVSLAASAR